MIHWPELLSTIVAGLAAGVGALPTLFIHRIPDWLHGGLSGFAGGMMTGAALLSLLPSALHQAGLGQVLSGIVFGAVTLTILNHVWPRRLGQRKRSQQIPADLQQSVLILGAIALHNLPEGLTMGVGYASGEDRIGLVLTVAIGIQNLPEGLLAALTLKENGIPSLKSIGLAQLTGLIEPLAAFFGMLLVRYLRAVLGFLLSFAAGSMLYAVSDTLIPGSHEHGIRSLGTFGFLAGVITLVLIRRLLL